jgi:hypothetical protein
LKIIFSRKGFDSSAGGCPSPIFPDGRILSLPIPVGGAPCTFGEVQYGHQTIGGLVESLTGSAIRSGHATHLDPDLRYEALARNSDWRPAFGQNGAAQKHLANQKVEIGDLFLFFGWFREVEEVHGRWRYKRDAPNRHIIFGWLQIDRILNVGSHPAPIESEFHWLAKHPHLHNPELALPHNTIYLAKERLSRPLNPDRYNLPGGGVFNSITNARTLTKSGETNRSLWLLPEWFCGESGPNFSYHNNAERWQKQDDGGWKLSSVGRGQEFVVPFTDAKEQASWLNSIFCDSQGASAKDKS